MYVTVPYNKVLFSVLFFLTSQSEVYFGIALVHIHNNNWLTQNFFISILTHIQVSAMLSHPQTVYSYIETALQLCIINIKFILSVYYNIIENWEDLRAAQCR